MNLNQLKYFLKVVECGSISKAAQQLYVSQPGITKAITTIENEYNIKLLERSKKGILLTTEGKKFVYYAKNIINATEILDKNFLIPNTYEHAKLFIAAQQQDFLYDIILKSYDDYENHKTHYVIDETDRCNVAEKVLSRTVSLGILIRTEYDGASLPWRENEEKLDIHILDQSETVYACIGPKSPFWNSDSITYEQAITVPNLVVNLGGSGAYNLNLDTSFERLNRDKIIFCNSIRCCEHLLQNTNILLFCSKWVINSHTNPYVKIIPIISTHTPEPKKDIATHELILIKRKHTLLDPAERNFIYHLANYFNQDPDDIFNN